MSKTLLAGMLILGLVACSPASGKDADGRTGQVVNTSPAQRTVGEGTRIEATIDDALSSRHNKAGETLTATVSADVRDGNGHVVIPAGSSVGLTIAQLEPATNKSQHDGKLALDVTSVTVRGRVYRVSTRLDPVAHQLQGRGVGTGEVEKVGAGAAIGALAGRLIGGNTQGAVIGGAIGAGGGTAVAVHWASRDVVVPAGTHVGFSLPQSLTVARR
jgi:hypothetical protein